MKGCFHQGGDDGGRFRTFISVARALQADEPPADPPAICGAHRTFRIRRDPIRRGVSSVHEPADVESPPAQWCPSSGRADDMAFLARVYASTRAEELAYRWDEATTNAFLSQQSALSRLLRRDLEGASSTW